MRKCWASLQGGAHSYQGKRRHQNWVKSNSGSCILSWIQTLPTHQALSRNPLTLSKYCAVFSSKKVQSSVLGVTTASGTVKSRSVRKVDNRCFMIIYFLKLTPNFKNIIVTHIAILFKISPRFSPLSGPNKKTHKRAFVKLANPMSVRLTVLTHISLEEFTAEKGTTVWNYSSLRTGDNTASVKTECHCFGSLGYTDKHQPFTEEKLTKQLIGRRRGSNQPKNEIEIPHSVIRQRNMVNKSQSSKLWISSSLESQNKIGKVKCFSTEHPQRIQKKKKWFFSYAFISSL